MRSKVDLFPSLAQFQKIPLNTRKFHVINGQTISFKKPITLCAVSPSLLHNFGKLRPRELSNFLFGVNSILSTLDVLIPSYLKLTPKRKFAWSIL